MRIAKTITEARLIRRELVQGGASIGFIPTMGYLHEGHISLVKLAAAQNSHVVVSVFVNPTQFGPNEDLAQYPRDLDRDLAMLEAAGVALVFTPTVDEMYPAGFQTYVEVTEVSQGLEGVRRPGHFRGVATVVTKLLNIMGPDRAYFGQKDAQQVAVIRRMVADLAFPCEIVVGPTVREKDGLAMSSRNVYLTRDSERHAAITLYHGLRLARERYEHGERSPDVLRNGVRGGLEIAPLVTVDYVSAADAETLQELDSPSTRPILLSAAIFVALGEGRRVRLIDNMILQPGT